MDQLALGFQITSLFTYHLAISATKTCMESFPYSSMMVKLTCLTCQRVSMLECSLVEKQSIKQLSLSIQWIRPQSLLLFAFLVSIYVGQTNRANQGWVESVFPAFRSGFGILDFALGRVLDHSYFLRVTGVLDRIARFRVLNQPISTNKCI